MNGSSSESARVTDGDSAESGPEHLQTSEDTRRCLYDHTNTLAEPEATQLAWAPTFVKGLFFKESVVFERL